MPLVEIVQRRATRAASAAAGAAFARRIDKLPLPCRSAPGFVVNRMLTPYMDEATVRRPGRACRSPTSIEAAMDFGMPMGPIELATWSASMWSLHVGEIIARSWRREAPPLAQALRELVATGAARPQERSGLLRVADGKPVQAAAHRARRTGGSRRPPDSAPAQRGVACLREGVVGDADLVDAGVIFGTGFAPFRGGPLAYARSRGRGRRAATPGGTGAATYGERFRPDAGWDRFIARAGT